MKPGCSSAWILERQIMFLAFKTPPTDLRFSSACLLVSVFASSVDSIQIRNAGTSMAASNGSAGRCCAQVAWLFLVTPSEWGGR